MDTQDERNVDPIQEMTALADRFLPLDRWGFKESFRSNTPGDVIYDSEWCRVSLVWGGWDYVSGNSISIYYGRLHASNKNPTMIWGEEKCHCWHRVEHALHFLDGRPVSDAVKLNYSHSVTAPFFETEFRQKFRHRQPEWLIRMHATIWQHYDKRLFELFDIRQSHTWEQYRKFLKEFYDIKGRSRAINPPMDKVC